MATKNLSKTKLEDEAWEKFTALYDQLTADDRFKEHMSITDAAKAAALILLSQTIIES